MTAVAAAAAATAAATGAAQEQCVQMPMPDLCGQVAALWQTFEVLRMIAKPSTK
jgi:hypothetical protein